ncbi:MAG: hypothetical protein U9R19_13245 [Bacteroidota bacterium]|nr:hypothetical protein [Bacteroidota bacterium]
MFIALPNIFLSLRNRIDKYESIGGIFKNTKENTLELKLYERLIGLLIAIIEVLETIFVQMDREEMFVKLLNDEQAFDKIKLIIDQPVETCKKAA